MLNILEESVGEYLSHSYMEEVLLSGTRRTVRFELNFKKL